MNEDMCKSGHNGNILELEEVSFSYGDRLIADRISLTVHPGEHIGIVGESGCGKSTLLKLLAGLYRPTAGTIKVMGCSQPSEISKMVSIVMQTPMLLPMTINENITLGHSYSSEWIAHILRVASLDQWIATLEHGIDTYLGDGADELSGGQAQRIAIARAMCKNAGLFLLDEPTSALDGETARSVLAALREFTAGKTLIHVTHQPKQLEHYDRIFRMQNGKLMSLT